ncbi:ankyrin repeat domain-containing protein [Saccharopolyspora oryzae]
MSVGWDKIIRVSRTSRRRSMVTADRSGWAGLSFWAWTDYGQIRARLDAGADPNAPVQTSRPLHEAAERGSPEVVAELARRVDDLDAECEGRTALWRAVYANRPDNARALVAAGADPRRPTIAGWSPARLSLAGPNPDLFDLEPGELELSREEVAAVVEGRRLTAALGNLEVTEGLGLACVAGISSAEAARRLEAVPVEGFEPDPFDFEQDIALIGATDVPGGCVISQLWGYAPQMPGVTRRLSTGTICYGFYANPKSGGQGSIARDGVIEGWDLSPGGDPYADDPAEQVLAAYLYQRNAVAYCCAYAGLRLTDSRAINGKPDRWLRLPERDYWQWT